MNTFSFHATWVVLYGIVSCISIILGVILSLRYMHVLQLEGYHFFETYNNQKVKLYKYTKKYWVPALFFGLLCLSLCLLSIKSSGWMIVAYVSNLLWCLLLWNDGYREMTTRYKIPLKYTKRIKRLMGILCSISIVYFVLFLVLGLQYWSRIILVGIPLYVLLFPIIFCVAYGVHFVIEKIIFHYYYTRSQKTIQKQKALKVIGITGSYGKTSTKNILDTLLKQKYNVLTTEKSYNTPMGISKTVLQKLNAEHQIFIAEMGADHKGDIATLCRQVRPSIGILTSIGKAHLKTFGSVYEIIRTKYALIENIPKEGYAVFNGDCALELNLLHKTIIPKAVVISENRKHLIDENACDNVCYLKNVQCLSTGIEIECYTKNHQYHFCVPILGKHQATNIGLCILVAEYLGVSYSLIVKGLQEIQSVEHRLSVKPFGEGFVLDDSFNCNIEGAKNALEVLRTFHDYEKVVITPGIVEAGEESFTLNCTMGNMIAKNADTIVIVNDINKIAITRGVIDANTHIKVMYAHDFEEAKKYIKPTKSVYLLLNDLPDQYQ